MDILLDHFPEMSARGLLIRMRSGEDDIHFAPNGASSQPDLTHPEARELGIDGWMEDFGECPPLEAVDFDGSEPVEAHRCPEMWMRVQREVMDELRPDGDWAVFSRGRDRAELRQAPGAE